MPAWRIALVAREAHKPRVGAVWQRCLGTINPRPESAADARNMHRGDELHQQLATLPTGAATVRAAVVVLPLGADCARHACNCKPWFTVKGWTTPMGSATLPTR